MNFKKISKIGIVVISILGVVLLARIAYNIVYNSSQNNHPDWGGSVGSLEPEEGTDISSDSEDGEIIISDAEELPDNTEQGRPKSIYDKDDYEIDDLDEFYNGNDLEGVKDVIRAIQSTYQDVFAMLTPRDYNKHYDTCETISGLPDPKINYEGLKAMGNDSISIKFGLNIIGFAGDNVMISGYRLNQGMDSKEIVVTDFSDFKIIGGTEYYRVGDVDFAFIPMENSMQIEVGDYKVIFTK